LSIAKPNIYNDFDEERHLSKRAAEAEKFGEQGLETVIGGVFLLRELQGRLAVDFCQGGIDVNHARESGNLELLGHG
jgi:hypothetical protein